MLHERSDLLCELQQMHGSVVAITGWCMNVSNLNEKDLTLLFTHSITKF